MAALRRPAFEHRLKAAIKGEAHFDLFSRGRYATDASIYQMMPVGVIVPRDLDDVLRTIEIADREGIALLPRGGGTSQSGQTVNEALAIDTSRHLDQLIALDVAGRTCTVEPGIVLDELNRRLKPHGLWFPVDVSTASRATIGGMAGNNSCGTRSIRYGTMRDNVIAIEAILADGSSGRFSADAREHRTLDAASKALAQSLLALGKREKGEIANRFPKLTRRVGGYNIDALVPGSAPCNLSHLLVGSEGTLGFFTRLDLKLAKLPANRVVGVCHFPDFQDAMRSAQHLVTLGPTAVELVDRTMIELARDIAIFQPVLKRFVRGEPDALLLVEFAEEEQAENLTRLKSLGAMMGDLGFHWSNPVDKRGGVIEVLDPALQAEIASVRSSGLNIMMSMREDAKPVSFVEDCAVELKDLADYTAKLTGIFEKHGTRGTWYAHASVGCLHVRPVLNVKRDQDVRKMRAIAEEAFALVRRYKGSHSGEHGDGIVRSEFHEAMFGKRIVSAFRAVKQEFDPKGRFNPGKIVDPPRMDDRSLMRYGPGYAAQDLETELDWSSWTGKGGGFQGAVEMCNNNGACRKHAGGAMCPSFRVTGCEAHVTRGRANSLRLAITGQLGPDALTSPEMADTMKLCVGCKACRRECPTGVDMARMKIEVAAARAKLHGLSLQERLVAWLPRYAPTAARYSWAFNLRDRIPGAAALSARILGFTRQRELPTWKREIFRDEAAGSGDAGEVVLFADTFNRYFEPENLRAARDVLKAAGYRIAVPVLNRGERPLCCGRTFLSVGRVDEARIEARRLLAALAPFIRAGTPVIGLEPSCLLTMRDEIPGLLDDRDAGQLAAQALLFEEFLAARRPALPLAPVGAKALLHGHCHQKAFDAMAAVRETLALVPELQVETLDTGCCGMAGSFGYAGDTYEVSMQMAELDLLPAVRKSAPETLIIADGTSCRAQIAHGTGRRAVHVARILQQSMSQEP